MTLGQRTHYPLVMAKEFYSIDPWRTRTSISWYPYLGQVDALRADGAVNRLREGDGSRVKNVWGRGLFHDGHVVALFAVLLARDTLAREALAFPQVIEFGWLLEDGVVEAGRVLVLVPRVSRLRIGFRFWFLRTFVWKWWNVFPFKLPLYIKLNIEHTELYIEHTELYIEHTELYTECIELN